MDLLHLLSFKLKNQHMGLRNKPNLTPEELQSISIDFILFLIQKAKKNFKNLQLFPANFLLQNLRKTF